MDQIVFTPAGLLELLMNIEELGEYPISISETSDTSLDLQIGDSSYKIDISKAAVVEVEDEAVEEVDDVNQEVYDDLAESGEADVSDVPIESGPIKELVKTLLLGGMVRLSSKILKEEGRK